MNDRAPSPDIARERVLSLADAAEIAGISTVTLRRLIARGEGPRTVRPSPRRIGVRARDLAAWLEGRLSAPSGTGAK